jgi:prolyl oligopeptidase
MSDDGMPLDFPRVATARVAQWPFTIRTALTAAALVIALIHAPSFVAAAEQAATAISYPTSRTEPVTDTYHGVAVADPYRWLEDADSPETAAWAKAQNALTFSYLEAIPQREPIRARMTELWNYAKYGVPEREGDWYFFTQNDGLQNQAVYYKQRVAGGEPSVFIDPNTFTKDGTAALTVFSPSHDARLVAYGKSVAGSDWNEFLVRDVESGRDLADHLQYIKFSGASWTHEGKGFFYSRYPAPTGNELTSSNRNHSIYYHTLGTEQSADRLIYERPDHPDWGMNATVTKDGRYVVIDISRGTETKNRIHVIDLVDPMAPKLDAPVWRPLDDADASYTFVGNHEALFYFVTDLDAPRGRLVLLEMNPAKFHQEIQGPERGRPRLSKGGPKTVIAESEDAIQKVAFVGDRFVVTYLHDAHSRVALFYAYGKHERDLELPGIGAVDGFTGQRWDKETFYSFTSYLQPPTIYRYDFTAGRSEVFRQPALDFDPSGFETRQVFFTSKDGTRVPMFLTHRKDLVRDGSNPVFLYGYGGFNQSKTPEFGAEFLTWLEMGGVFAVANLRGGGEYGEAWHAAGKLDKKQNVFDDFIGAAEYLVRERYTLREKLAIHGRSNGGLLVGAVVNQRPDLCAVALPMVGVMDMLRFTKFTIGWAWTSDFGSPETPEGFRTLRAYSPYHNIAEGIEYPATLVTTGDHDDRVVPAHSYKYTAALQAAQAGDAPCLIRIDTSSGHKEGKATSKQIEERVDQWAFAAHVMGMSVPRAASPRGAGSSTSPTGKAAPH